jgi:hypothetical protein
VNANRGAGNAAAAANPNANANARGQQAAQQQLEQAQQRLAAQQTNDVLPEQAREQASQAIACMQQAAKDHPGGGSDTAQAYLACTQAMQPQARQGQQGSK